MSARWVKWQSQGVLGGLGGAGSLAEKQDVIEAKYQRGEGTFALVVVAELVVVPPRLGE